MTEQDVSPGDPAIARIRQALDQGARELDAATLARLYDSRRRALAALHAQHVGGGLLALRRHPVLWGLALTSALILFAWLGLRSVHPPHALPADTGELDIQLLTGELPPQVFADWSLVSRENVEAVCLTESSS